MKTVILYYNFIVVSLLVFAGFLSAHALDQIIASALFFPLFIYFALAVSPRTRKAIILPRQPPVTPAITPVTHAPLTAKRIPDFDRRTFLKLIGSAGVTVFLYALFSHKAEAAFFGSVPGPGTVSLKDTAGNKIDPAIKLPTDGYNIARLDESLPGYYGFINKDGAWFIMREEDDGTYKYQKGPANFVTTGWNIRNTTLQYYDFDSIF